MWLWVGELHRLGFRRRSERYWQCERGYGLPAEAYVSIFAHALVRGGSGRATAPVRADVGAFHVTFCLGVDRIHFYYHEADADAWEPGGHTSGPEIRRYGVEPSELRERADAVAKALAEALGHLFRARNSSDTEFGLT
jgi:hypothetical protein